MRRIVIKFIIAVALAFALFLPIASSAAAHTIRDVGAYRFTVGWGTEPAYAGQLNSVQLLLATLSNGKPYTRLTDTLTVTVIYGQQNVQLPLTPTFDPDTGLGTPGDYRGWLFPTVPGNYTFHFTGSIGSQKIDQSFTSGPTTFATVEDPAGRPVPGQGADRRGARHAHRRRQRPGRDSESGRERPHDRRHRHRRRCARRGPRRVRTGPQARRRHGRIQVRLVMRSAFDGLLYGQTSGRFETPSASSGSPSRRQSRRPGPSEPRRTSIRAWWCARPSCTCVSAASCSVLLFVVYLL